MSDILEIGSCHWAEFEETQTDVLTSTLKEAVKNRKGRGFVETASNSAIKHIKTFDVLNPFDPNEPRIIPQKSVEGWVIFVTGIHEEATEDDVKEAFSEYGFIKILYMNLDRRTGFQKGYAFIKYDTFDEANNAKENVDGTELLGKTISVNWCFVKGGMLYPKKCKQLKKKTG